MKSNGGGMADNYDQLALSWVRKEINKTLDQARQGLEAFAENSSDESQIQFCISCLHQVRGTLQMLEFYGASLLAEEMEHLAAAIAAGKFEAKEKALEVLMGAMLQLPIYLERVEEGRQDLPIILLPLLNELRASRGESLLNESAIFAPKIAGVEPPAPVEEAPETKSEDFAEVGKKLRAHYQKGLLGVLRGQNVKESLMRMHKVLLRLEAVTQGHPVSHLWWVADGFIFAIAEKGGFKEPNVHALLGKIDRHIKRLADLGDEALTDEIPPDLLKNLLYYVARSQSKNERIVALKDKFNLGQALPDESEVETERQQMLGPDKQAMDTVVNVIHEDLNGIKDRLDLFVRAENKNLESFSELLAPMRQISDTLGVLGLGIPRDVILEQVKTIEKLVDTAKIPSDSTIMDIAGAMLFVEANLSNVKVEDTQTEESEPASEAVESGAKRAQVDEAQLTLLQACKVNLQSAKDSIIEFIASGFDFASLEGVTDKLDEVRGGIQIIGLDDASGLLNTAYEFINDHILSGNNTPVESVMDALADVMTSVEYYLDSYLEGNRIPIESVLKAAFDSAEKLRELLTSQPAVSEEAHTIEVAAEIEAETAEETVSEAQAVETEAPVEETLPIIESKEADESLIDDEVLEIFLEEAEEELESINDMLPRWINDAEDEEALTSLRRSFHTLKGSGRLVGATVIGELAWSIENMLNRVIDGTIANDKIASETVSSSLTLLPGLVTAFSEQKQPDESPDALIHRANQISKGVAVSEITELEQVAEIAEDSVAQEPAAPVEVQEPVIEAEDNEPADPVLLEIFANETSAHVTTINEFLSHYEQTQSSSVTDDLIRALHTLKGSAHMAQVNSVAELAAPLESLCRDSKVRNQGLSADAINILSSARDFFADSVDKLNSGNLPAIGEVESLIADSKEQLALLGSVSTEANVDEAGSGVVRDPELFAIFLAEGLDILQEAETLVEDWQTDPATDKAKKNLQAEMHTLKRGANMASLAEVEVLASRLENFFEQLNESHELDDSFFALVQSTCAHLEAMLNMAASDKSLEHPFAQIAAIDSWLGLDIQEEVETESVATVTDAPAEASSQSPFDSQLAGKTFAECDIDEELVEFFVEEAEEIMESLEQLVADWKQQIDRKPTLIELRRAYHTLKGSSRMAGAMSIGELSYALEDLFNDINERGRDPHPNDIPLIEVMNGRLQQMVSMLHDGLIAEDDQLAIDTVRKAITDPATELPTIEVAAEVVDENEVVVDSELEETPSLVEDDEPEVVEESSEIEEPEVIELESLEPEASEADETAVEDIEPVAEDLEPVELESLSEEFLTAEEDDELETGELAGEELSESAEADETQLVEVESVELEETEEELVEADEELLAALDEDDSSADDEQEDDLGEALEILPEEVGEEESLEDAVIEEVASEESITEETVPEETTEEELVEDSSTVEEESIEDVSAEVEEIETPEVVEASEQKAEKELPTFDSVIEAQDAPEIVGDVQQIELDEDGEEVLEIYLEEADELMESLDEALHLWGDDPTDKGTIEVLQRNLHTMKGGARLSDLTALGNLTHEMETFFESVADGRLDFKQEHVGFIMRGYDEVVRLIQEVKDHNRLTTPTEYMEQLEVVVQGGDVPETAGITAAPTPAPAEDAQAESATTEDAEVVNFEQKKQEKETAKRKAATPQEVIRVGADQLETLVNLAGETSIFRSRLEQQMSELRYNLDEMNQTVERLREQLRNLEIETEAQIQHRQEVAGMDYEDFDPLEFDRFTRQQELSRGLSESANDLLSLKDTLDTLTADSETLLLQQGRVATEMQERLMRTRMVPFESLVPRLRRMTRQISNELGKNIDLSISADGEMDRTVLERMIAPLEHMLRNAMDHGIESPQDRKKANKAEIGKIRIKLFREGGEVFVQIQDDGRGLALEAIRKKALERGIISEATKLSEHELQQLILEAGFSTAEQVTQISGRGVGMDVVNSEIKQLGGLIEIDSTEGKGTVFTVKLPFTVSVNQALMVQVGDDVYAVPLTNIEGIVRVSPYELEEYYSNEEAKFEYAGIDYDMRFLGGLLDHQSRANLEGVVKPLPVLLLHGAEHPTAVQVDELLGSREIVVKSVGQQLSTISGLSGATILGDGRVVLILDLPALMRRMDTVALVDADEAAAIRGNETPKVMVVDDSITVRKVTARLLERHDYEVLTAKDGVDALNVLHDHMPDVMLLDIEMPRMDGFELATIIRHDERMKGLPIIMITSRTGEKHRDRAESIGVNRYMGKPYNEVDLLQAIESLLPDHN